MRKNEVATLAIIASYIPERPNSLLPDVICRRLQELDKDWDRAKLDYRVRVLGGPGGDIC